ncbi:MAG TPA: ATPase domain-containing protein, partial [Thermoanaerobaculia bacterium]
VQRLKARRLVVDSLSGFELALAPTFREDFRESLYRMVAVLTGMGVTMMMTAELEDSYTDLRFSPHGTAFLTDVIIMQRYIELKGCLQRVISVVKVRGSAHSNEIRAFEISKNGIAIGEPLTYYNGLLTGHPIESEGIEPVEREPRKRQTRSGR